MAARSTTEHSRFHGSLGCALVSCIPAPSFQHIGTCCLSGRGLLQGLLVSLHPLHFFFIFLFYTDVGSTFFVLAAYLVSPLLLLCIGFGHIYMSHGNFDAT